MRTRRPIAAPLARFALTAACAGLPMPASAASAPGASVARLPRGLVGDVRGALPEGRTVARALLSPTFDPNLLVSAETGLEVTLLWNGAGYRNVFGYFTWRTGPAGVEILDRAVLLRLGEAPVRVGTTVALMDADGAPRTFVPGTRIGFFVASDAAAGGVDAEAFDAAFAAGRVPSTKAAENGALAQGVFTTVDALNPEVAAGRPTRARHVALLRLPGREGFNDGEPIHVLGLEDRRRDGPTDDDFNDLIFLVRPTVPGALEGTHAVGADVGEADLDGDGLHGARDLFPEDPTRAGVRSHAPTTLTGRDGAPVPVATEQILDGAGALREIVATFHRGPGEEGDTLLLRGLPAEVEGRLEVERFLHTGAHVAPVHAPLSRFLQVGPDGSAELRYPRLFRPGEGGEVRVVVRLNDVVAPFAAGRPFPWRLEGGAPHFTGPLRMPENPLLPQPWSLHAGE